MFGITHKREHMALELNLFLSLRNSP